MNSTEARAIEGVWERAPGRVVHMASTESTLLLAEVPEAGAPMCVHVRREADARWQRWLVPPPSDGELYEGSSAWLAAEEDPGGCKLALTRVEYQGGSEGIALVTFRDGQWVDAGEIPSPTDSDIAFGRPLLRRGEHVFSVEAEETLWHYTRALGAWKGRVIETPWPAIGALAANRNATVLFVAGIDAQGSWQLARFEFTAGRFVMAKHIALPGPFELAQAPGIDGELHVGFQFPTDGTLVWTLSDQLDVLARAAFPAPTIAKSLHLAALSVSRDWMLVTQLDDVWVMRRADAALRRLVLPVRADGRARRPLAVVVGAEAVVCLDGRVGRWCLG